MNRLHRIFKRSDTREKAPADLVSKQYSPEMTPPADHLFTRNFKENGGKFLYGAKIEELYTHFDDILFENSWSKDHVFCFNKNLQGLFNHYCKFANRVNKLNGEALFCSCEHLIASEGSILLSSRHIREHKLADLPKNLIVYATTSQLVNNKAEGMKGIKNSSNKGFPTNITALKNFKDQETPNFLSYGSAVKNLYLLLLEDL